MAERWVAIPGYEGRYEVSDQGQVRSWGRGRVHRPEGEPRLVPQREILSRDRRKAGGLGVLVVALYDGRAQRPHPVHRLVLTAFVGPRPGNQEARHLNDNRHDNRLENLAWGTRLENAEDARRNGIRRTGERNGRSKITAEIAREIRARRDEETQEALGERFGLAQSTVSAIQLGKLWPEL